MPAAAAESSVTRIAGQGSGRASCVTSAGHSD
jgi:hypothetical protein